MKSEFQIRDWEKPDKSKWIVIRFIKDGFYKHTWVPAFRHLAEIIQRIAQIEDEKYPQWQGFAGWRMVRDYFARAANPQQDLDALDREFQIPDRETRVPTRRY